MSKEPSRLNDTKALSSRGLPGPYSAPLTGLSPGLASPEFSMSKPGFRRETNAGDETMTGANAALSCE